jgi:hypothetical protein
MRRLSCMGFLVVAVAAVSVMARPANAADDKWGTIKGQVVFPGDPPAAKPLAIVKDQAACLAKGPILSEELVVNPSNKGVKNVFVWITTADGKKPPIAPALVAIKGKEVSLDQPMCAFVPHSQGMREGQTLVVKNTAPIAHNVNWAGGQVKNPGGNVIVPSGKDHKVTNLKADKAPVGISCNIHGWMKGWIRVFDHPYFAVTDADGKFEIKDAPAGKFKIWYWTDAGWKGGAAGKDGFDITIKGGDNDLGKVEWK